MTKKTPVETMAPGKPKEPPTRPLLDAGFGQPAAPKPDTSPIDAPKAEE